MPAPNARLSTVSSTPPQPFDWRPMSPQTWFGGKPRTERNFGGEAGFLSGPQFTPAELERVRQIVQRRLAYNAYNLHGSAAAEMVETTPLPAYHTISSRLNHSKMLTKTGRILPKSDVDEILGMSIFTTMAEGFGKIRLADEDNIGHQQICMRVARPSRTEDVGSLHRDSWFWDHYNWPVPEGMNRTKVWIGVDVAPAQNGLMLVPGSHTGRYGFAALNLGNKVKFEPDFDPTMLGYETFPGEPGACVVFNYGTLHIGRLNTAPTTRVSIEFTVLY